MSREDERREASDGASGADRSSAGRSSGRGQQEDGEQRDPRGSETTDTETPPVEEVTGPGIPIRGNDVDTDQIIPARFLKVVTFDGLGEFAFFDRRFSDDDEPKDHPMNEGRFRDASVMVVNANFGCGSSREHAPQALMRWGIDAFVGESFAEIFAGNCLALGMPTVTADQETVEAIQDFVDENPDADLHVDVADQTVTYGDTTVDVTVDEGQRKALVDGIWDTTALMKANREAVARTAGDLPYVTDQPTDAGRSDD